MMADNSEILWERLHGGKLKRLSICEYRGSRYADIREFYQSDGAWTHGRGCTIPLSDLPEFKAALSDYVERAARKP